MARFFRGFFVIAALLFHSFGIQAQRFSLFNWVRYNNTPSSLQPWLQPLFLSSQSLTNADSTPNFSAVRSFAATTVGNTSAPVTLDVEIWPYSPNSKLTTSIDRYIAVMDTFRSVNPNGKLGYYGVPPQQRYSWLNINTPSKYAAWMVINDSLARMADRVDLFFPSAYSRDTVTANWANYIDSNVSVIRSLYSATKPIYFYIWPQYDGSSSGEVNAQFIDTARWKFLLELIYEKANGAVIWTSNKDSLGNTLSWDPGRPWWTVTKEFMVQKGLVSPFVLDSLTAVYQPGGQAIRWVTSADTTTAYFVVERSGDSASFSPVSGVVASLASYYTQNGYRMVDSTVTGEKGYYRLRIVGKDSSVGYSNVVVYAPPVSYRSVGTGVTVDLAASAGWLSNDGSGWVAATRAPNGVLSFGSVVTICAADNWQNNIAAVTLPVGAVLVDSGANGVFSTTSKITASGTIVYAGSAAQSIPAIAAFANSTLTNLTIANPAGVSTTTGTWTLTGTLVLQAGTFNCNNGGGSFLCRGIIVASGGMLNAAGYFEPIATFPQSIPAGMLVNNSIFHLITGPGVVSSNGPVTIGNSIALGTGTFVLGGDLMINGSVISSSGGGISAGANWVKLGAAGSQVFPRGFFKHDSIGLLQVQGTTITDTIKSSLTLGSAFQVATIGTGLPLYVLDTATVGGLLYIGNFAVPPTAGQQYVLLSAGKLNGQFSGLRMPVVYKGSLSYTPTSVILTIDTVGGYVSGVSIYPNPVRSVFTVRSLAVIRSIVVYDVSGRVVRKVQGSLSGICAIQTAGLAKGTYFVTVIGDDRIPVTQAIKLE